MLTLALYGLLAIVVAGALFLAAAYLLPPGEQIAPTIRDEPLWDLPSDQPMTSADVAAVRLPVALRGYRFAETDLLLDRLAEELQARDQEIARLRGEAPGSEASETWERPDAHASAIEIAAKPVVEKPVVEEPVVAEPVAAEPEPVAGKPEPESDER